MKKTKYNIIGVMSGTSLDGIDLAYITFQFDKAWQFEIHCTHTYPYPEFWHNKLQSLTQDSIETIQETDQLYTTYVAQTINLFINSYKIKVIDAVCSHGHTALHQPDQGLSLQIGNLPQLAALLKQTVVCDFRVQDVKLGGQGAPLVPIGDKLLFHTYDYCLNIGGFANISYDDSHTNRIAFDICPANIVLNYYANILGFPYDVDGKIAATGVIDNKLLEQLNSLSFYQKPPPKSLGLEWVQDYFFTTVEPYKINAPTVLRTIVEHIAQQISKQMVRPSLLLITGGGVHNTFLIKRITALSNSEIIIPPKEIIDYKEALVFGFLGVLKLENKINCLSSVTGAKYNHSSGVVYKP